jgi:hypothetical protein
MTAQPPQAKVTISAIDIDFPDDALASPLRILTFDDASHKLMSGDATES